MINEIYQYAIIALIGSLAHILRELARLEKITEIFSLKIWLKKNKYTTIYGFLLAILAIIVLWYTKELNWASAIMAGYTGDSLLKTKITQSKK
jgi:hypothetical protein